MTDWREEYADLNRRVNDMHTITVMTNEQRSRYAKLAQKVGAIVDAHPEIKETWNHDRYS